ncbi:MAG: hypothetical protein QXQ18_00135 [Candidatus Aenigmatarchaeota archaeon]
MNVGQFFILALFLTFLVFILPVILTEFGVLSPNIVSLFERVKDILIVKILGYSPEAARFPDVIFTIILPFGIALAVILIFLDFMQKNIFPNVSPSLFFFLGWFISLIATRFFGPIISGIYAGLGFYATVAFGAILIITIAIAFKLTGAGLMGLFVAGIIGVIFSFGGLWFMEYLGLTKVGFGNIIWLSIFTGAMAVGLTYMYARQVRAIAPQVITDIDRRLTDLHNAYNELLAKINPELPAEQQAKLYAELANLRTEIAALEEQKRKLLIETA